MKFCLKPSLEQMALFKIAFSLWNQNDVRAVIAKLNLSKYFYHRISEWDLIEDRVIAKVSHLSLPGLLEKKMSGFIKPIGLQLLEWIEFHFIHFDLLLNLPAELYWTPQGRVDRKRTAEVLVKDENLDISARYKLACIYCMEDDIIQFWNKMPEDHKKSDWDKVPTISFWSRNMKRRGMINAHTSYRFEFDLCARMGNKVAAEYFLQKLTPLEKEKTLVETAKRITDAEVLCVLLSKMEKMQQLVVFKNDPCRVLECFLWWPFQSLFIGVANCMWDFISKNVYDDILRIIIQKVEYGYKDWNYLKLLGEFWQESPSALKSLITNEIDESLLISSLCHIKDKETVRLILKDSTFIAKEKLIYSGIGNTFCESYIHNNEWDFLEFLIRECLPSISKMLKFKEDFEKRMMHSYSKEQFATKKHNWDQIFSLSGNSIFKYDKRSLEEGESSAPKRFHSLE